MPSSDNELDKLETSLNYEQVKPPKKEMGCRFEFRLYLWEKMRITEGCSVSDKEIQNRKKGKKA